MKNYIEPDMPCPVCGQACRAGIVLRHAEGQPRLKLGDVVYMNEQSPYFHEWRGMELKIVSLRIAPDGKLWASVIDAPFDSRYRGYGTYDGETTDIDAEHLSTLSLSRPNRTGEAE